MKRLTIPVLSTALLLAACGGGGTTPSAADTTAPTVNLSAAQNGTTVNLTANTSDNVGVTKVEFYRGTEATPFETDTTAPYTAGFTVSSANNGTLNVTAKAYDAAGNQGQDGAQVAVFVAPADTTAPVVKLTAGFPTTRGIITLTATVNEPVSKVEFYWNDVLVSTDTTAPYSMTNNFDRRSGLFLLVAKAYDLVGNIGTDAVEKLIIVDTLYQGDWLWMTFDAANNVSAAGIATFYDEIDAETGKIAIGFNRKRAVASDPNSPAKIQGGATLGPITGAGKLQTRLYMDAQIPALYVLAEDDNNTLEDVQNNPTFSDNDAEIRVNGTSSYQAFVMKQLSSVPYLTGLSAPGSNLSAQSVGSGELKRLALQRQTSFLVSAGKQVNESTPTQTMEQFLPIFKKQQ